MATIQHTRLMYYQMANKKEISDPRGTTDGPDSADSKVTVYSRNYHAELGLFLLIFFSYGYFYNGAAWNHNSRLNTIFAFVEPGSSDHLKFSINRFISNPEQGVNTGDWAKFDNKYYSNKAPGPALLGIPLYFCLYHVARIAGLDPVSDIPLLINAYLINLFITVFPVSLSAVLFFRVIAQFETRRWALFISIVLFFGTLMLPFSTQLWGHATAAAFIIFSLYFFLNTNRGTFAASGFFSGLAVLTEYSCLITVVVFAAALGSSGKFRNLRNFGLGGLVPFVIFVIYHKLCFGSFFTIANFFNNPYFLNEGGAHSLFGGLNFEAAFGLTFSPYRGLFFYMPVLLMVLPAMYCGIIKKMWPPLYWICISNIGLFFLMNVSFNGWHGGACTGPRYQIPVLPFYALLLLAVPKSVVFRRFFVLLFSVSFANMFICTAISPIVPASVGNPLSKYYQGMKLIVREGVDIVQPWTLPIHLQGEITPAISRYSAFNIGELVGLSVIWSLITWGLMVVTMLSILTITVMKSCERKNAP